MGHAFAGKRREQRVDMLGKVRSGVDNGDLPSADYIRTRAAEGERPGVARDDPTDVRRDRLENAIGAGEASIGADHARGIPAAGTSLTPYPASIGIRNTVPRTVSAISGMTVTIRSTRAARTAASTFGARASLIKFIWVAKTSFAAPRPARAIMSAGRAQNASTASCPSQRGV